ncbi:MAG: 5'/3'-nucleotidase SurE [Candidatus Promineifilaceae bacterium]|nr:5'/3'-nucleotidase SurE [Candidatus Promineifilaceae bacterium]
MESPLILITNDDGIDSPGLKALLPALDPLGELLIVAPRVQQTSMGRARSQNGERDGRLFTRTICIGDKSWPAYAANATPALAVDHALQLFAKRAIDLVISGINYGENVGSCVTVSGTIGAALEAADHKIPAIAASLELETTAYHEYDQTVDFTVAASFVRYFAGLILGKVLPDDVDLLKIEIPAKATKDTPWTVTRQDKLSYYQPVAKLRSQIFDGPNLFDHLPMKGQFTNENTDAYALAQGLVSVTPMSLDLTSRVSLDELSRWLGDKTISL